MKPLKILIVEDEIITAMDLQETLQEAGHIVTTIARTFQDAVKAVRNHPPDLALIDIHLEGSSADGIETAKKLLEIHHMPIMYLTANSEPETFQSAKETLPVAYLLKPFRHDELKMQVELAYNYFQFTLAKTSSAPVSDYLYFPVDKGHEKIDPSDVLYIEADGSYVKIFLANKKNYHISMNLSHLAQYFPTPNFHRLSRSLLINLNYLERLEANHLYLVNHEPVIPIPAASRKELMNKLRVVRTKKSPLN
ncbi:response regulator [Spirosoma litoris]